jgi:DNA-binding CsgD family transcriptional regulator
MIRQSIKGGFIMQHFLMVFYVLFFATGFMGVAALILLEMRVRSRLLRPLLLFQVLFLAGLGLLILYFYLTNIPEGASPPVPGAVLFVIGAINTSLYVTAIVLIRRISPPSSRRKAFPAAAEILALLVIIKGLANISLYALTGLDSGSGGSGALAALADSEAWTLGGHILTGLAIAAIGVTFRGPLPPKEPPVLKSLMKAYGLCTLIFAPLGLLEYAVARSGILGFSEFSVDYLFYLAWNIVSMSAAIRLFKLGDSGIPALETVPAERVAALGLSGRETEMAVMIARGLTNKEIASELCISPATVRTHIYNLYQKAGARSRVELINRLRS